MQSVSCDGRVRKVQDRFGKRKFQDYLAFIVGHFEDRIEEAGLCAFGLQQLPDHCPRNFPCAVGIAQLFALGIGNQLAADTGVEEIPRHGSNPLQLKAPGKEPAASHKFFPERTDELERKSAAGSSETTLKLLIRLWFDVMPHKDVNSFRGAA